ncbi:MAG: hypothetical protein IPQ19_04600 [Bacteroidetes bacterium]|nr:hypothetical protein [Bacteroidota bacterium]
MDVYRKMKALILLPKRLSIDSKIMAHKIIRLDESSKEIENAIEYYSLYSVDAPLNCHIALKSYETLKQTLFSVRYKNIRALKN